MSLSSTTLHHSNHLSERRPVHTLRLSVTERCNFRCSYCAPTAGFPKTPYESLPTLDELADAANFLVHHWNVRSIKLTGGEPLLRKGLPDLVKRLTSHPDVQEISLTTNGSRLKDFARPLKEAGLRRVNVSLDTLDPRRFRSLCGGDLSDTLSGIRASLDAGLTPLKLNAVLRRDFWKEDVTALLGFAAGLGVELRFIELMPVGPNKDWASEQFLSAWELIQYLEGNGRLVPLPYRQGAPARTMLYVEGNQSVKIGLITPESESFCDGCNRLRLDSHGRLRRCLMDPATLDLVGMLADHDEVAILNELGQYLADKQPPALMRSENVMIAVGG